MGLQYINNYLYLISMADITPLIDISPNINPDRLNTQIRNAQDFDLRLFLGDAFYYQFINSFADSGILTATFSTGIVTGGDGTFANIVLTKITGSGTGALGTVVVLAGVIKSIVITNPGFGFNIGDTFSAANIGGGVFTVSGVTIVINPETNGLTKQMFYGGTYNDTQGYPVQYMGMIPALVYMSFARFIEFDPVQYTATGPVIKHHDASDPLKPNELGQLVSRYRSMANAHLNNVEKFLYVSINMDNNNFPLWRPNERNKNSRQPGARIRGVDRTKYNRGAYGNNNWDYGMLGDIL